MTCATPDSAPSAVTPLSGDYNVLMGDGFAYGYERLSVPFEVLTRVYARCVVGLEGVWIGRMDEALHLGRGQGALGGDSTSLGDVKYHNGFSSDVSTPGGPVHLSLAFNPSHLEIVNPVVEGSVRARQFRRGDTKGDQVLPVLIHGDAAVAGQGV